MLHAPHIIDVRAPIEFAKGALPNSINLPILSNEEREAVGTCYKHSGQQAAIALGHKLVSGATRRERESAWEHAITTAPGSVLCCWRGGLRSSLAQQWLAARGVSVAIVEGGYKALRHTCLEIIEAMPKQPIVVLAGRTGSGKTEVLNQLPDSIDLEGLANHRGSAFGSLGEQPSPASFENALAGQWHRHQYERITLEDESRLIGRVALPTVLHEHMASADLVLLEISQAQRIDNIRREYVEQALRLAQEAREAEETQEAKEAVQTRYENAIERIRRRLGGADTDAIRQMIRAAFASTESEAHNAWIGALLQRYYDPMYDYQLEKKQERVRFKGDRAEVIQQLSSEARKRA